MAPAACHESLPRSGLVQRRAFLAQRRGHGRPVGRKLLIRAGGLKTCWTKPQGTAVPQLWGLQHGEGLRGIEKATAKGGDRTVERTWCRVEGANVAQSAAELPWKRELKLRVAKVSRSRDRASSVEM
jgi:hypothetical protein